MVLRQDFNTTLNEPRRFRADLAEQIVPIAVLTVAWGLFVVSSFNYRGLTWFPWLFASRVMLVLVGGLLLGASLLRSWQDINRVYWYLFLGLVVQASHGALESSGGTEFYSFTGVLFLATCLGYRGIFMEWIRRHFPLMILAMLIPLFFKDRGLMLPFGNFVDHFSLPIAGVVLGLIIARINSAKFQALMDVISLKDQLVNSERHARQVETDLRNTLQNELAAAKEQIRRESKQIALANVAAQVAHDIRSPLASLIAVSHHAEGLDEHSRTLLRASVTRIKDIANNLLSKHRGDMKAQELVTIEKGDGLAVSNEPKSIGLLSSIIDSIVSEKRLMLRGQPDVVLEDAYSQPGFGIFADIQPVEFGRMLSNIINNAYESFERGGLIEVSLFREGRSAVVRIKDNGKGIAPDVLPTVGQKGATFGKEKGNGLGLYHARGTAEYWGGDIRIESAIGVGTIVSVRIPIAETPEWFASRILLNLPAAVLVLDDDPGIHEVWKKRFNALGRSEIHLTQFQTAQQLLDWYRTTMGGVENPVYLFDYELIGSNETGLEVIQMLGIARQSILVTSRAGEPELRERCRRLGVRVLPKGLAAFVPIAVNGA